LKKYRFEDCLTLHSADLTGADTAVFNDTTYERMTLENYQL